MKYVCKKKISYCDRIKYGMPYIVEVNPGDILEYVGMDERRRFEFLTKAGDHIFICEQDVDGWFEELNEPVYYKLSGLLNRLSKIEYEIAELRIEMEDIMRESE